MQVLLIEDSLEDRQTVKEIVEDAAQRLDMPRPSFREMESLDTAAAAKALIEEQFAVAVVDHELRGSRDGVFAIAQLSEAGLHQAPRIIVYTGRRQELTDVLGAVSKGAFSYVIKPDHETLKLEIERAIRSLQRESKLKAIASFADLGLRRFIFEKDGWAVLEKGKRVSVAVMFCDLANSSKFIQDWLSLGEQQAHVVGLLRSFFDFAGTIVKLHGGIIDKYIGDELMCYFGGTEAQDVPPAQLCTNAARAAMEIRDGFEQWLHGAREEFGVTSWPDTPLGVKVAANFGPVIWGLLGTKDRVDVSILTREVIKAARLMQHLGTGEEPTALVGKDEKLVRAGSVCVTKALAQNITPACGIVVECEGWITLRDFPGGKIKVCRLAKAGEQVQRKNKGGRTPDRVSSSDHDDGNRRRSQGSPRRVKKAATRGLSSRAVRKRRK